MALPITYIQGQLVEGQQLVLTNAEVNRISALTNPATSTKNGIVRPDNVGIKIDVNGVLSLLGLSTNTTQYIPASAIGGTSFQTGTYAFNNGTYALYTLCSDMRTNCDGTVILNPIAGVGASNSISFNVTLNFFSGVTLVSPLTINFSYEIYGNNTNNTLVKIATGTSSANFELNKITSANFITTAGTVSTACSLFFIRLFNASGQSANGQTILTTVQVVPTII